MRVIITTVVVVVVLVVVVVAAVVVIYSFLFCRKVTMLEAATITDYRGQHCPLKKN